MSQRLRRQALGPFVALLAQRLADVPVAHAEKAHEDYQKEDDAGAGGFQDVVVATPRTCSGYEKAWQNCPSLPKCDVCKPTDCAFAAWSDWFSEGGCTGLCRRHRLIKQANNECGQPCTGALVDTKKCIDEKCIVHKVDCQISDWAAWSTCNVASRQRSRSRAVATHPENGGLPCTGALTQTEGCGVLKATDCQLSEWGPWTLCSASCDGGSRTKMRSILGLAEDGGKPCEGVLRKTEACNPQPCEETVDCQLMEWSDWNGCEEPHPNQRFRIRGVKVSERGGGAPCADAVSETEACPTLHPPSDLKLSQWTEWSGCDRDCAGGQRSRKRSVLTPPKHGGSALMPDGGGLKEVKPCNTQPCPEDPDMNCKIGDWGQWSLCSAECGIGETSRSRPIIQEARPGGDGCSNFTEEVKGCKVRECEKQDCVWNDWEEWGSCSATCGGGDRMRARTVGMAPRKGGKLCEPEDRWQVAPCGTEKCQTCIDGQWGNWSAWSDCSATCDSGFRKRHRDILQQPNSCGKPVEGSEDEYEICNADPCIEARDCKISDWDEWSKCSLDCFGVRERHRRITQYAQGAGKSCPREATKEISPCNPLPGQASKKCLPKPPATCQFGEWSEWGSCSADCNGGDRTRVRHIATPADLGGMPCEGTTLQSEPCNSQECVEKCIDCQWGAWQDWSDCARCRGQKYRRRSIKHMANHCGKICIPGDAKETAECAGNCEPMKFCAWSEWSDVDKCTEQCGPSTKTRQRSLSVFMNESYRDQAFVSGEVSCTFLCGGTQISYVSCPTKPCAGEEPPQDCKFADWSHWSEPTWSMLCERRRTIGQTQRHGGKPCDGNLVETKECPKVLKDPQDCKFDVWTDWSPCATPTSQRHRARLVVQEADHGGHPCEGPLSETDKCSNPRAIVIVDCKVNAWSPWSACSQRCGGGLQFRNRSITEESKHRGLPCEDSLQEMQMCNARPCGAKAVDCILGDWSEWGITKTSDDKDSHQLQRERSVVTQGLNGGIPCNGALKELAPLDTKVDCQMSDWTHWGNCSKECGGGQHARYRQIARMNKNGGDPCENDLVETAGCNSQPCVAPKDCIISEWTPWTKECSVTCGSGQLERTRKVISDAQGAGLRCLGDLSQTKPCTVGRCPATDCKWQDWSEWSSCSCSCGGGMKDRTRRISVYPLKGGLACESHAKSEVIACNTQSCSSNKCQDGKWEPWSAWGECTQTCKGGVAMRHRKIAEQPNHCGHEPTGHSKELAACNVGVECVIDKNCSFSEWTAWTPCTKECSGVTTRTREFSAQPRGDGKACEGALMLLFPCNPGWHQTPPPQCQPADAVDCVLTDWVVGECSATCGVGQRTKSRDIKVAPTHRGKPCEESLRETEPCNVKACPAECQPVDCLWEDWSEWSACARCVGEKRRERNIKRQPACGGRPCEVLDVEEVEECPRKCGEDTFCGWGAWTAWSACSATCDVGRRSRQRNLEVHAHNATASLLKENEILNEADLEKHLEELKRQSHAVEAERVQELILAFGAGLCALLALVVGFRWFVRRGDASSRATWQQVRGSEGFVE
eukprot:TRINITY_DN90434_c0_g1_i1.p1 TRINITY_DN90434_c0_g1~~TRINITY_DN90434_c0_g1_i1.p1  ORF type:complete len:1555 (-),score=394.78 TRINITY_DN90434_c0_g1_i1:60-4724(-)